MPQLATTTAAAAANATDRTHPDIRVPPAARTKDDDQQWMQPWSTGCCCMKAGPHPIGCCCSCCWTFLCKVAIGQKGLAASATTDLCKILHHRFSEIFTGPSGGTELPKVTT
jgi:hypothetical protein